MRRLMLLLVHSLLWMCKVKSRALHYGIEGSVQRALLLLHFGKCIRSSIFMHTEIGRESCYSKFSTLKPKKTPKTYE